MNMTGRWLAGALGIMLASSAAGADGKAEYDRRVATDLVQLFESLDRDVDQAVTLLEAAGDVNFLPRFADMDIDRNGRVTVDELARYVEQTHGVRVEAVSPRAVASKPTQPPTPAAR